MAKAGRNAGDETPCRQTKQRSQARSAGEHPQHDLDAEVGQATLALSMSLPGTRLDMALGAQHPLLLEIVLSLARQAARAHHAATAADAPMPTQTATNKKDV